MKEYTLGILDEEETEIEVIETCFENEFNIITISSINSVDDLINIIKEEKIDVLSIDYKLKDHNSNIPYNGDYFFTEIMERFGDFPAFVLTRDVENARNQSKKINPRFIVDKEDIHKFMLDKFKEEKNKFIEDLQFEIVVHRNKIAEDVAELQELQELMDSQDLSGSDQNRYMELNNRIEKSISGYSQIPMTYFSKETNDRLDDLIQKTEDLLNKLEEK
ncbi:hypothetical protein [Chryseobacterium sp. Hurlbut01]|uniref:hypothetical protein n=1 Tax=Chryseobacterium sp. Hurlbut01 TaxID=1681828 RepID=UPI00067E081B|nr:hypothetical protein [Chryseobacterium sp. Hurlbut01]KNB62257.1 hypothetical protein AC804_05170 [Chryseobacterium sp. Hurlbut01]